MSRAYGARFADALGSALGDAFTVSDLGHGLMHAQHDAGGVLVGHVATSADRRGPVRPSDVVAWIAGAAVSLRRNVPHYTPEAAAEARRLLADLDDRA